MAIRVNPELDRRAGALRRRGRARSATTAATAPPSARSPRSPSSSRAVDALPADGPGEEASGRRSSRGSATTAASAPTQCPRDAEPGETMMSLRRWLTARYDFTGISRLFYRSWKIELVAIVLVALLTGVGLSRLRASSAAAAASTIYDGPNAFLAERAASMSSTGAWPACCSRCCSSTASACGGSPWDATRRIAGRRSASYVRQAYLLPLHFITQKRYAQVRRASAPGSSTSILMLSYVTMLVLIMFFLPTCRQGRRSTGACTSSAISPPSACWSPSIYAMRGRLKKTETHYKHSHEIGLDLPRSCCSCVAVTGILQHILHRAGAATWPPTSPMSCTSWAWCRCWCSRCRSASGRTWPIGRWRCTSPRSRRGRPATREGQDVAGAGRAAGGVSGG